MCSRSSVQLVLPILACAQCGDPGVLCACRITAASALRVGNAERRSLLRAIVVLLQQRMICNEALTMPTRAIDGAAGAASQLGSWAGMN